MGIQSVSIPSPSRRPELPASPRRAVLLGGAPIAALLIGLSAEWLDFRELRIPLLLIAGFGVLATAYARYDERPGWQPLLPTLVIGMATWGAAQTIYVVLHTARGESFDAARFGPQWAQALGLIAAHMLFLGAPTGLAAALLLRLPFWRRAAAANT